MSNKKFTSEVRKSRNNRTGAFGEEAVVQYLLRNKMEILDRNWRVKEGEIDIVARSYEGIYIFIEVKTRSSLTFGHPLESIDRAKAQRLQRLALAWLATHSKLGAEFQIDCAAVLITATGESSIEYRARVL